LAAIEAYEQVVGLGSPQLALLYLSHGSALQEMVQSGLVPEKARPDAAKHLCPYMVITAL